ncbi:centrosomal protein of 112 kDa isoform X3 [Syngnathoides biaculeatus]|uniref:centrosomal protein of 112 kDa isoform X3 n=1 Tax=Syngnathoides biaculeatus TaxID=300417 RepID=UPI002ADD8F6C|nr:centrosomal protein of 112 kDa isoform X3 [Syngnathoides biaculeatus]
MEVNCGALLEDVLSKNEDSLERLNSEWNNCVLHMKPYVLKHPNKTERQHCAMWIKKLCDPATGGSSLAGYKNRNLHGRLLLHMLKRGVLEGPFAGPPQAGSLKSLPAYMSIYFDEPVIGGPADRSRATLPEWVAAELDDRADDILGAAPLTDRTASAFARASHLNEEKTPRGASGSSPRKSSAGHEAGAQMSRDDSDLEARLNTWNLESQNRRCLREKNRPLSPIFKSGLVRNSTLTDEVDLQLLDRKEILQRRNAEMSELKSRYRAQLKEAEEVIRKLERKVESVLKESQVTRESKDKHIAELKKMTDQSADCLKNEWEKKLQAAVAEVEKDKFDLQEKHTADIQELLDNTKMRLAEMEAEYVARSQSTVERLRELEEQVRQQRGHAEKSDASLQKLTREKAQLEGRLAAGAARLREANRRMAVLQKEKDEQNVAFEETLQKFRAKHEARLQDLQREQALTAAKASEAMEDFEKTIAQLNQQLLAGERHRETQVRDQDLKFRQEKEELRIDYDKKVVALLDEAEKERTQDKRKIAKLEDALRDAENQLERARESQRLRLRQADAALEELGRRAELGSEKAEAEFKLQLEKMEEDLQQSRSRSKELSLQADALRQKYEQQMAEQRVQHEQERTRLQQRHCAEKDSLVQERQREVSSLESRARAALRTHQEHTREWRKRDGQTISDLEAQLSCLREELRAARVQHKRQLAEMAALRDEEKQKAYQDGETLRSDTERVVRDLRRSHRREKEAAEEKINNRLKHIEKEYSQTLARSAQVIAELRQSVRISKEEAVGLQRAMMRQREEADRRWAQDRENLTRRAEQATERATTPQLGSAQAASVCSGCFYLKRRATFDTSRRRRPTDNKSCRRRWKVSRGSYAAPRRPCSPKTWRAERRSRRCVRGTRTKSKVCFPPSSGKNWRIPSRRSKLRWISFRGGPTSCRKTWMPVAARGNPKSGTSAREAPRRPI